MIKKAFFLVLSFLLCSFALNAQTATVNKIWLEHGAVQNNVKGLKVHVSFDVEQMKGRNGKVIAYFDSPKGTGVKDKNGRYCTTSGTVCTSEQFCPRYEASTYSDFTVFIPNEELHLYPGKRDYYCRAFILDVESDEFLANSDFVSFSGTGASRHSNANQSAGERGDQVKVVNLPGGGEIKTITRPNGSITTITRKQCMFCHGTTVCAVCSGLGGRWGYGGIWYPCTGCFQTCKCSFCENGYQVSTVTVNSNGQSYGTSSGGYVASGDGAGVVVTGPRGTRAYPRGGSSGTNNRSRSSSGSRSTCSACRGKGYQRTAYSHAAASASGWMQPYHHHGGSGCPHCNSTSDHYHYPCTTCHGYGTVKR